MKKIVSLTLALVMIAMIVAGCAAEEKRLVGTWKGELDMTASLLEEMGEQLDGFELQEFRVTVVYTFREDGTYEMGLDEASVQAAFDGLIDSMKALMKEKLEQRAQEQGKDLEQLLANSGLTVEDLMKNITDAAAEKNLAERLMERSQVQGRYKAEDGKLYITTAPDEEISAEVYDTYALKGDVLTLTNTVGSNEENLIHAVYPVILKKLHKP